MNEQLLTIALLIIVVCNLGVLLLYWRIYEWTRIPTEIYGLMLKIQEKLNKFARSTDYDFRAVKTRLADEERDDQREKHKTRSQPQR